MTDIDCIISLKRFFCISTSSGQGKRYELTKQLFSQFFGKTTSGFEASWSGQGLHQEIMVTNGANNPNNVQHLLVSSCSSIDFGTTGLERCTKFLKMNLMLGLSLNKNGSLLYRHDSI